MLTSRVDVFFFYLGLGEQDDPFEKKDVAWAFPDKAKQMITRIEELEQEATEPTKQELADAQAQKRATLLRQ